MAETETRVVRRYRGVLRLMGMVGGILGELRRVEMERGKMG